MNIFTFKIKNIYYLISEINLLFIFIILLIGFIIKYLYSKKSLGGKYEIDKAVIGIGQGQIEVKPNNRDYQIAYQLWIEISTRQLGQPIDFDNDIIEEIYDSWYDFFGITRVLIKEIPVSCYQKYKSTKEIVEISFQVLNQILRPHLTKWQAKYRKWLNENKEKYSNKSPQEIQKKFPEYDELIKDLRETNNKLKAYKRLMEEIAKGK
ncbi:MULTISPECIES: hypothetical protein [Halanaerobium]|jgi:hypothetical protein|uniref:Uncharacterized protein n=1 Tax=Halanaerobium congolense TaxID=54121 RepID=A0A4R7DZW4_9FIRM|nr:MULTISPECIES: hypothetical protein [Halanaerobium]PUU87344.1 MAG: hypothetical protein CI949_3610 [Halanaerobium sp.]TDS28029.1 hypothetical protein BY453_1237 [Halanaerobium congolense]